MKTIFIVVLLTFIYNDNVYSQDSTYFRYNKLIELAEKNADSNNFNSSLKYYNEAFDLIDYLPYHYIDAFIVSIKTNDYPKAYQYITKGTLKGLDVSGWYLDELDLFNQKEISNSYYEIKDSLLEEHFKSIDIEYYTLLKTLKERDQSNRNNIEIQLKNDSLNFDELVFLSSSKGFPTFKRTGYGYNYAQLLLWHHRDEYPHTEEWKTIIPLIEHEIKKGLITPKFFEPFDIFTKEGK